MVTLATLLHEIILTRIFSVTMWYHYAFMAISVALFGMTVGAILVYLFPRYFAPERTHYHLALSAWLFSLSIVVSFLTFASIPFVVARSPVIVYSILLTYAVISVPFVFGGICVSLALTRFPRHVGRLYATDLAGAACGCLAVIFTLWFTDGPGGVLVAALLAAAGAALFSAGEGAGALKRAALISSVVLALAVAGQAVSAAHQAPWLRVVWVKGVFEQPPLYQEWNAFSRIAISGDPTTPVKPSAPGLSATIPAQTTARELSLNIDSSTGTLMTALDGGLRTVAYLKDDVINLPHYIRHNARVLVIGSGGGRDILSALVFGQRSVVGVEINQDIIDAVNRRFGDFTGHLDRDPRVTFVADEARSYIARQRTQFDIIQASFASTWAATAAGAYVLTENSLYTVEAWKLFLDRLSDHGILTFTRWYFRSSPTEIYRMTSLATASLEREGVKDPRGHIIIVRNIPTGENADTPDGIGTILVSKQPFSDQDIDTIEQVARAQKFDLVLTPRYALDATFAALASGKDVGTLTANFPFNISAPTDDSPFFFNTIRLRDVFKITPGRHHDVTNEKAVLTLAILLIVVIALTVTCIIVPLILTTKKAALKGAGPLFVFFASIGLGFMFVEISQMQRLIIFLGHPTYGLSVVLFALLLSSGLGSQLTQNISSRGLVPATGLRLVLLLCALALFGKLTPYIISEFQSATTMLRILLATSILFPLGVFMGMAFPLGMAAASTRHGALTPWLWGINGATSVCASVLATAVSLNTSISASFWTGFASYAVAGAAFVLAARAPRVSEPLPEQRQAPGVGVVEGDG